MPVKKFKQMSAAKKTTTNQPHSSRTVTSEKSMFHSILPLKKETYENGTMLYLRLNDFTYNSCNGWTYFGIVYSQINNL